MKTIVRRSALAVYTFVLALLLPTAASAACAVFDDVLESADLSTCVEMECNHYRLFCSEYTRNPITA